MNTIILVAALEATTNALETVLQHYGSEMYDPELQERLNIVKNSRQVLDAAGASLSKSEIMTQTRETTTKRVDIDLADPICNGMPLPTQTPNKEH